MINTILIFPIIAGILMLLVRKRAFDNLLLNVYAIMHFIITLMLTFTTKMSGASHYFACALVCIFDGDNIQQRILKTSAFIRCTG